MNTTQQDSHGGDQLRNAIIDSYKGYTGENIWPVVIDSIMQLTESYAEQLATRRAVEARIDELLKAYNEVVGEPNVPIRSKFVKKFTAYHKSQHETLTAELKGHAK